MLCHETTCNRTEDQMSVAIKRCMENLDTVDFFLKEIHK